MSVVHSIRFLSFLFRTRKMTRLNGIWLQMPTTALLRYVRKISFRNAFGIFGFDWYILLFSNQFGFRKISYFHSVLF